MTEVRGAMTQARPRIGPVPLVVMAMVGFSVQDVVVKVLAEQVSLWQLQFIRSLLVVWLTVMIAAFLGTLPNLAPKSWFWPMVRAVFMTGAYLFFYASLPLLPLSQAAAAFFTGPLMITLLAALVLGEPIGPRRIVAVIIGFLGVLCIIRPGLVGWQPVALLPVLSAFCYAIGIVITRWRCQDEANFALSVAHNLLYAAVGLIAMILIEIVPPNPQAQAEWPFLLTSWWNLSALAASLILFTAGTHLFGVLCSVRAYQMEDASRIAPFEYVYLAIMPLYDILLWNTLPPVTTLIGMVLICGAGVFVARREGRPPRPQMHPRGEMPWTPDDGHGQKGA